MGEKKENSGIHINIRNVVSSTNDNTNNNENVNRNTNVNVNLGTYRFLTWGFGLIILTWLIFAVIDGISDWLNEPSPYEYKQYSGRYNVIKEFFVEDDIVIGANGWVISDIVGVENRVFGIYIRESDKRAPDTLVYGSPSDIYAFLDESYYAPKRIQYFRGNYILVADKTKYRTVISHRNKYDSYSNRDNELERNGAQCLLSFYSKKHGWAYAYSMNNCYSSTADDIPLTRLIDEQIVADKEKYVSAYCYGDPAECTIINASSRCGLRVSFNYYQWSKVKNGVSIDDVFDIVKTADQDSSSVLTIIYDDTAILVRNHSWN